MTAAQGDPLSRLDRVPWPRLQHAYGSAADVPAQLRSLRSPDPAERDAAYGHLWSNVYHQGTRWPASSATVPFLVALTADATTPARPDVLRLLTAIAIGDRRDDRLPYRTAPRGEPTDYDALNALAERLNAAEDPADLTDEETAQLDAAPARWAAQCYAAAAEHADTIADWPADPDDELAARAAALLAWFPPTERIIEALLAVDERRPAPRRSANLALAHTESADPRIDARLRAQLDGPAMVTAAVALAYRQRTALPDQALAVLIDAAGSDDLPDVPGWTRATRGFVMLALQRLGL